MTIAEIQNKIRSGEPINTLEVNEIKYIKTPIGNGIYKNSLNKKKTQGRPKKDDKAHWSDIVTCKYCKVSMLRSNQSSHKKTKKHQIHMQYEKKIRDLVLQD